MNTSKLAKQIKKELTRNTKKTVALALVSLVALWFWAPLASKWLGGDAKKKKSRAAAKAAAETAATTTAVAEQPVPRKPAPKIDWDKLLDRIAKDELMTTATLPASARDPFAATPAEKQALAVTAVAASGTGTTAARPVQVDPTPEEVGLKLEGTMVAGRLRRAVISGKTYRPGDRVRAAGTPVDATQGTEVSEQDLVEFEIKSIEAKRVVLSRQEKEFALVLKPEGLGSDNQLLIGSSVRANQ